MDYQLIATPEGTNARAGLITTDHGQIETPIFMPVGTVGAVKAVHMTELREDIKAQIILGNTYHLYLRPGMDIIERAGGPVWTSSSVLAACTSSTGGTVPS